jgi:CRISPR-associated protein Cas1
MQTLYVSQQGCYIALQQEQLLVKRQQNILTQIQLPLLEQVLIFGKSQMTTQAIRACLSRDIPIVYLSRMGYCYGRILAINRGYRQLARYQQELSFGDRIRAARAIVATKLSNSRTLLQRYARRQNSERIRLTVLHQGSDRHAALASNLLEEFRAPLVDSCPNIPWDKSKFGANLPSPNPPFYHRLTFEA